jgi:hypothetical protein
MQMYDLAPRGVNPLDRRCFLHLIRERQTRAQCRIPPGEHHVRADQMFIATVRPGP